MICDSCGMDNSDGMAFCGRCGASLRLVDAPKAGLGLSNIRTDPIRIKCPSCGQLSWNPEICSNCSARLPVFDPRQIERMRFAIDKKKSMIELRLGEETRNGVVVKKFQIVSAKCPECGTMNQNRGTCVKCGARLPSIEDFPVASMKEVEAMAERYSEGKAPTNMNSVSYNLTVNKRKTRIGRKIPIAGSASNERIGNFPQESMTETKDRSGLLAVAIITILAMLFIAVFILES